MKALADLSLVSLRSVLDQRKCDPLLAGNNHLVSLPVTFSDRHRATLGQPEESFACLERLWAVGKICSVGITSIQEHLGAHR